MDTSSPGRLATLTNYGNFLERTGIGSTVETPPGEIVDLCILWRMPCFVRGMHQLIHGNESEHHRMCPL